MSCNPVKSAVFNDFYKIPDMYMAVISVDAPNSNVILFLGLIVPLLGIVLRFRSKVLSIKSKHASKFMHFKCFIKNSLLLIETLNVY